jgi:hypothetical protein
LIAFETNSSVRKDVIKTSSEKSSQSVDRLERYFGEVINRMDPEDMTGLKQFLYSACQMKEEIRMAW